LFLLLQNGDQSNLTDEVCAEHDSMKDRAKVEIEKAATITSPSSTPYHYEKLDKQI